MFLGLDLGTTNVKALVVGPSGLALGQGSCPVPLFHVGEGGVEQDIEQIWEAACSAIRQAVADLKPAGIRAIGVSSQGGALQLSDVNGRPLGRVISWLDQRGQPWNAALTDKLGSNWFVERLGHAGAGLAIGQLLRLADESPTSLAESSRIGFVGDTIVGRLTGRAAHDGTSGGLTLLYNPTLRDYDPDVLRHIAVRREQLPDLLPSGVAAGSLSGDAGQRTGLPAGIPVSAAIHDQYAAALATGAVLPGTTLLGTGTAWVLLAVGSRPTRPATPNAFVCHHVIDHLYGQILSMVNGGSALTWALNLIGQTGINSAGIDQLLGGAPPGCEGLGFWPFLAPSSAAGLAAGTKGRLSGLRLSHGPTHLTRAVIEGLAFDLKRHLFLFQRAGISIDRLVVSGAAATSRFTPQILADVTGLPLACGGANAGSVLGAAIIARGLQEPAHSLAGLAAEMSPPGAEIEPGPNEAFYAEQFEKYIRSLPLIEEN